MKKLLFLLLSFLPLFGYSQINLTGTSYSQNFDGIAYGLPTGWYVYKNATSTSLGNSALSDFESLESRWSFQSGKFRNCASADGQGMNSSTHWLDQETCTDRALSVRQSASFGDPGAAFAMNINNTIGKFGFNIHFRLQSLDVNSSRLTTWKVQYAIGASPNLFTTLNTSPSITSTGQNNFSNLNVNANFGTALDNINAPIWIRIVALDSSTGSGYYPTTGIDDVSLTWSNTPPPKIKPVLKTFSPLDEATSVPTSTKLILNFDTNIVAGNGSIKVKNLSDNTVDTTLSLSSFSIQGKTATSAPITLPPGKLFAVVFDSSAFLSSTGGKSSGIYDISKWNFTTKVLQDTLNSLVNSFQNCDTSSNMVGKFTRKSLLGARTWNCTNASHDADSSAAFMKALYSNPVVQQNLDYLISPPINMNSSMYLSYWQKRKFTGDNTVEVLYSNDYDGVNPATATWIPVYTNSGTMSSTWHLQSGIDLSAASSAGIFYVAFRYSASSATTSPFEWTIDQVSITPSPTAIARHEIPGAKIEIQGNPIADGTLHFTSEMEQNTEANFSIYNAMGQKIISQPQKLKSGYSSHQIDVSELAEGYYTLRIETAEGSASYKLYIQ